MGGDTRGRSDRSLTRRRVLRAAAGLAAAGALGGGFPAVAREKAVRMGYVSPQSGPLAAFAEADAFILEGVRKTLAEGIAVGGRKVPVEILVRDSQSNPNRAAEVASELILGQKVNVMLVSSRPETTNPVSDQCEVNEVPCISTVAPWQAWFFTRGGDPTTGFEYTYHFFWGLEDVIAVYLDMWSKLPTNKQVGGLFPNDGDGNAWGNDKTGFPPELKKAGYALVDPGRYQNLTDDFSAYIGAFKNGLCEIITGVVLPPDFTTFWSQARQQGLRPRAVSVGKALLFPRSVEALGDAGQNLSTEVWWSPRHPFRSSLTGETARQLADGFTAATGKQWSQPIGFAHALFELAVDALKRAPDPSDAQAVVEAIRTTSLDTVVGPVSWQRGPVRNVARTPLVGGQWRLGGPFKYDLVVTSNSIAPAVPVGGEMQALA